MSEVRRLFHSLLMFSLCATGSSSFAFSANDAKIMVDAYNSAFYAVDGANAYFRVSQTDNAPSYFWGQAEMIECVIDAYEWTGDPTYQSMITSLLNGFLSREGTDWTWNEYNDDMMWAVLAFARGGVATGNSYFRSIARNNFDACYARAWDNVLGGGLYWRTDNQSKNACSNGNAAIAAYLLYQIYGDINYLNKANAIYNWERSVLFNPATGAIYDAKDIYGTVNTWSSTYNQGTFIGAAHFLGHTNDATLAADYTMINLTSGGILPEYPLDNDLSGFNAIFLRWMTRFMKDRGLEEIYGPWLQLNATAAWNARRATDHLTWCKWIQPTPVGTTLHSWDCISSFSAMLAAEPTQGEVALTVPKETLGYWPLDATSGTVAVDVSGSGNDGTVSGATWLADGRIGGCLDFNGVNSSVQVNNPLGGDFSIAFWVRTTQTAGTANWYNGAGLVDGDVPFGNNDFGTALVGSKFGFGVGNPDTTIVSSTLINDGAWHLCVATRQRTTGLIRVYVDGNLEATGTGNRNLLSAPAQLLFGAIASGGHYFDGSLDEVKIFSRTLSSEEVAALYQSSVLGPPAAPTHLTAISGAGQVQLEWWEASLATSYNVKRSLVEGGPYVTVDNVAATAFTDTTALNNRTYYYVVSSSNCVGESADSAEVSVNTSTRVAWFRADAMTGLANGAPVSLWPDSSGNGNEAMQTLSANQPTYVTGAMNGLPVVRFNSANNTYLWFYRPVQDDFTMIFVFQSSQGIGTATDFWTGAGLVSGERPAPVNDFAVSLNANGRILAGTGNPDKSIFSSTGYNNGQPHVVTFKRTRSTGSIILYVDGSPVAASVGGTQSLTAPNFLVLGGQGVLNNFLSGDIAEVQVYSTALSDSERQGLENALKCKYGLGGAIPAPATGLVASAGNRQISLNWTLTPGAADYNLYRSTGGSYQLVASGLTTSSYVDTNAVNGQLNIYRVAGVNGCGEGPMSVPAAVYLPLPVLGMTVNAEVLEISWPEWASDWELCGATNLTPPVVWTVVTNAVLSTNGQFMVSIPIDSQARFFRLVSP